ncbi:MAG: ATPase domain-containing protein, partial [Candidatus Jordarchaeaceae archaeon]
MVENIENPFIVIDSIEAIQKVAGEEVFNDLLDLCRELNSKLIFVSEYEEVRKYDYLVDGVILLKRYIENGRIIRVMQIEKLRGINCKNPQYLFTLHAGRFKHLDPFKPSVPKESKRFEPTPC